MQTHFSTIRLQAVSDSITQSCGVNLYMLRTDLNHPHISGNKLFKLKYNLQQAQILKCTTLLTFGGAYSNHIAATAAAGKEFGLKTIGIIRGDKLEQLNHTLQFASDCGMELHYVSRRLYQDKEALNKHINQLFSEKNIFVIPEGGSNEWGVKGCEEILDFIPINYNYITAACGTGATLAGIIRSMNDSCQAIGFQILKGEGYIKEEISQRFSIPEKSNWQINEDYHFGGYAKTKNNLLEFIRWFTQEHAIPLDVIYTGKMMFGVYDLMQKGAFKKGEAVVAVHTGGLQGNLGFDYLFKKQASVK